MFHYHHRVTSTCGTFCLFFGENSKFFFMTDLEIHKNSRILIKDETDTNKKQKKHPVSKGIPKVSCHVRRCLISV